jgi:hypothetical protein
MIFYFYFLPNYYLSIYLIREKKNTCTPLNPQKSKSDSEKRTFGNNNNQRQHRNNLMNKEEKNKTPQLDEHKVLRWSTG